MAATTAGTKLREEHSAVSARGWLSFLLLLAAFNSAWAAFAEWLACRSCITVADLVWNLPLGWLGVFFYGALFIASLLRPSATFIRWSLVFANLGHTALLGLLALNNISCSPCIATALCAWGATGAAFALKRLHPQ